MTIATVATIAMPGSPDVLDAAIAFAEAHGAHLDVTVLGHDAFDAPAVLAPELAVSGLMIAEDAAAETQALEESITRRLDGAPVPWSVGTGAGLAVDAAFGLARRLRMADIVILPHPAEDAPLAQVIVEMLLHETRVPVLLMPKGAPARFAHVALGWDDSAVALAAARAALPILHEADRVRIVSVDPAAPGTGFDLATMLVRHGLAPDVTAIPRAGQRLADALSDWLDAEGTDLLVMGAYGTGRLRGILAGSVTRPMLAAPARPILLAR